MKAKHIVLTILPILAIAVGCKPANESTSPPSGTNATLGQSFDQMKAQTAEAMSDLKDYSYAQKADFSAKMREVLAEMDRKLDDLSTKIENSTDANKTALKAKLQMSREKSDSLKKQLDEVGTTTEAKWDELKAGIRKSYDDLKSSIDEGRQWLSDKIAPK